MCGRYSLHHKAREVAVRFDAALNFPFEPRYNIAPSQEISAILADPSGNRTLEGLRWGLVPHWTRDIAAARRPINARAETLAEKLTFREALRRGRCLIPASGFYEWQKVKLRLTRPWFSQFPEEMVRLGHHG